MRPLPPRRNRKDYLLPFLIIVSLGVVAALLLRLWGLWSDDAGQNSLALSGKAQLTEIAGGVEVYLPATNAWKITSDPASLNPGESVRTAADGGAQLKFDDGSVMTLGPSSELSIDDLQNALAKKEIHLSLTRGAAWIAFGTTKSDFELASDFLKIRDADGQLLVNISDDKTTASAVSGGFTATILDPQNTKKIELKNFVVETGKTIEISERRVNLLRIGGEIDLVKATPEEILSSDFYLAMSSGAKFTPTATTETAENTTPDADKLTTDAERDVLPAPLIVTGQGSISAVAEPVKVLGRVSPKITKVEVAFEKEEAFALAKFVAGSGEWSYNASRAFGNLKVGVNNYSVIGYDADGNKTPVAKFQIIF
ncbi:MAG: FecR family protein, partial [Patescibacteria group bacterium]